MRIYFSFGLLATRLSWPNILSVSAWAGLLPHSAGLVNAKETRVFISISAGNFSAQFTNIIFWCQLCAKQWGFSNKQDKHSPCPHGVYT